MTRYRSPCPSHAYLALDRDGTPRGLVVDDPDGARETGYAVARHIRRGRIIVRLPESEARARLSEAAPRGTRRSA